MSNNIYANFLFLFLVIVIFLSPAYSSSIESSSLDYEYNQSTYIGGLGDDKGYGIEVDNQGNIYIAMDTTSKDLFTSNNAYQKKLKGGSDLYIAKFSSNGSIIYGTYIGGIQNDRQKDFTIDDVGNVYITGYTLSNDLPVTNNALSKNFGGVEDAFLIVLNSNLSNLLYSSYLGGLLDDRAYGIKLDNDSNVYVTGYTNSNDFQVTDNAYQKYKKGINWTTGSVNDINFQNSFDCFVSKININTGKLEYSTYFGGEYADYSFGAIDVDNNGFIYIAGSTNSLEIPVTSNAFSTHSFGDFDYFLSVINNDSLIYSTYIGGRYADEPHQLIIFDDFVYILGDTLSNDFPTTYGAYKEIFLKNDTMDGSIIKFNKTSWDIVFSTLLGGTGDEDLTRMAIDYKGNVFVTGFTVSLDYPITDNAYKKVKSGSEFLSYSLSDDFDNFCYDCIISEISCDGSELLYSTYYGANSGEYGQGIKIIDNGFIVSMQAWSDNLKTNKFSYQENHKEDKTNNSYIGRNNIYQSDMYFVIFSYDDRINTTIDINDFIMLYGYNNIFNGRLIDFNGNYLVGKHLSLNITRLSSSASKVYDVVTNYNGLFNFNINLAKGNYLVCLDFFGDDFYKPVSIFVNLKIFDSNISNFTTVLFLDYFESVVGSKDSFRGHLYDINSVPIAGQKILLNLTRVSNGLSKLYYVTTDYNGVFTLDINLAYGFYKVLCSFSGFVDFLPSYSSGSIFITF